MTLFDPQNDCVDEIVENERKNHRFGHTRYSKESLGLFGRSPWTDLIGSRRPRPEMVFAPSPLWHWKSSWVPFSQLDPCDEDGWSYSSGWNGPWKPEKSFGKLVRRRRWIRIRTHRSEIPSIVPEGPLDGTSRPNNLPPVEELDSFLLGDAILSEGPLPDDVFDLLGRLTFVSFQRLLLQKIVRQQRQPADPHQKPLQGLPPRLFREMGLKETAALRT